MNKMTFSKLKKLVLLFLMISQMIVAQSPMQVAGSPTITATNSGNWSNPTTWGNTLPKDDDRVLIPEGISVTVDGMISEEFKSVRIANGGKLTFSTTTNSELRTEYLFSGMMGVLEIGNLQNKMQPNVTASLVFAERGGTTKSFDPDRYAPGAVLMGTTNMHGAEKTSWLTLQTHPSAGDNEFILEANPIGWQVGDQLVIAGTDPITNAAITSTDEFERDEVVTITGITDNIVSFSPALIRDHKAPSDASHLDVHVANLSRNIKISSENNSLNSLSGAYRKPRGHIMFMHTMNVDLRYVEAKDLGRTDKRIILDDWDFEDLARDPNTGNQVTNGNKNPRGRYSFHFHRGGLDETVSPPRPKTPLPTPVQVVGCVVNNDPGWAYVNHSSRVDFIQNVSYDVIGGAFNTEAGNETGSFIENIAIRTVNPENPIMEAPRPRTSYIDGDDTPALADAREGRQDFAWQGDGFWLHGTGVTVKGNIVSGCTGHAYVYWTDGLIEKGLGMTRGDIDAHVPADEFPALNQTLHQWQTANPNFWLDIWYLQPRPFQDNIAYGFVRGIQTYYVHTEFHQSNDPSESAYETRFNDLPALYKDQLDMIFDGTILWNIGRRGIMTEISANISIINSKIYGYNSRTGFENYGTNPAPDFINDEPEVIGIDLDHFHNTHRWRLANNTIEGFSGDAVGMMLTTNAQITVDGGNFNNDGIDIFISAANQHFDEGFGIGMLSENLEKSSVTIQGNINFQNPNRNIVMDAEINYDEVPGEGFPLLGGPKQDPEFLFAPQEVVLNFGDFNQSKAYFNEQDSDFTPIKSGQNNCSFSDPSECVNNAYVNKTNLELFQQFNRSYLSELAPDNAVSHPMIIGGKVENGTLSSDDIEIETALSVFPNPSKDGVFKINASDDSAIQDLKVYNLMGQQMRHQFINKRLYVNSLAKGIYLLSIKLTYQSKRITKKIIIE